MKMNRRLSLDLTAARYLDAVERSDFDAMNAIWEAAQGDADLEKALHEVHAGLVEEELGKHSPTETALVRAVETHLPSAEIIREKEGPITVADVAEELFRHAPDRLPALAHALNEKLRTIQQALPTDLGLTRLTEWAEAIFGAAPPDYWKA